MRNFFTYVLSRPDGRPCYVGKGVHNRWKRHWSNSRAKGHCSNPHLAHIIRNVGGSLPVQVSPAMSEEDAFDLEKFLIEIIGREDVGGPLVNLTEGGEGVSGFKFDPETVEKIAAQKARQAWCDSRLQVQCRDETENARGQIGPQTRPGAQGKDCRVPEAAPSRPGSSRENISHKTRPTSQT